MVSEAFDVKVLTTLILILILILYRIVKVSDTYSLEELCEMTDDDMEALLRFYTSNEVPRLSCLKAIEGESDVN
jgi:hypothetical protein